MDPIQRLLELYQGFERHPGRAPGGSGTTGVGRPVANSLVSTPNSPGLVAGGLTGGTVSGGLLPKMQAKGYGRMIGEQQEFQGLQDQHGSRFQRIFAALKGLQ